MNYKERLVFEFGDLSERIVLLQKHIETKTTSDKAEDEVLKRQLEAMLTYRGCLAERIMKMLGE